VASVLTLMAGAALAHTLGAVVRRRRRDLAILKTLGFVRRQVWSTVAWQATTMAAVGLTLGVPLGISAGRWAWRLFADGLGIVPEPVLPLPAVALLVPIAFLAANLVAAVPGRAAARTQPALVLRAE
jgi:ABC-type lipoprotein release transport system permease subunit